VFCVYIIV